MSKRTFQPSNIKRKRTHGFRSRMSTRAGRAILNARRAKGRKRLSAQVTLPRFKLPKTALLRKGREFEKVYRQGSRWRGKGFSLIFCPNELGYNRIGISVHRKLKGAVKRNRIKRIIRESFRLDRSLYPACADIVFAVRPDFSLKSPADITSSVAKLGT